ncbi:cupin domain-containing protein [Actinacidiphila reveromycinica]|uniref:cupin domain-containing protein n=1 Tax=Actinacidiphila reveromycinica TaxID=659352 RepID=UPI003D2DC4A3
MAPRRVRRGVALAAGRPAAPAHQPARPRPEHRDRAPAHPGPRARSGPRFHVAVPAGSWQRAEPAADREVLVSCVVPPGPTSRTSRCWAWHRDGPAAEAAAARPRRRTDTVRAASCRAARRSSAGPIGAISGRGGTHGARTCAERVPPRRLSCVRRRWPGRSPPLCRAVRRRRGSRGSPTVRGGAPGAVPPPVRGVAPGGRAAVLRWPGWFGGRAVWHVAS